MLSVCAAIRSLIWLLQTFWQRLENMYHYWDYVIKDALYNRPLVQSL